MRIEPRTPTTAAPLPLLTFYCRFGNRVLLQCPQACGPASCPLRGECPAYVQAPLRETVS